MDVYSQAANVTSIQRSRPLTVAGIHDAHAGFVWQSLQRLGVRDADLDDMTQEVFLVVLRKLEGFEGHSRLTTWLFAICLRVASAYRHRAWVRHEVTAREQDLDTSDCGSANQEEALAAHQAQARLEAVLSSLDLEKRAVFVMFEIDELSCDEIAEIMGVPVGTVYSRLHAARNAFRTALARTSLAEQRRRVPA